MKKKAVITLLMLATISVSIAIAATGRPPFVRQSTYVRLSDGTRIAVDLYLPRTLDPAQRLPAVFHPTRYYRRVELRWPASLVVGGVYDERIRRLTSAGYAYVLMDMRGSGASFGTRAAPWSRIETSDAAQVAQWVTQQPWSNGKLGVVGWSYDGAAAELLSGEPSTGVVAVAPQYSPWDGYLDTGYPNGVHLSYLTKFHQEFTGAADQNRLGAFLGGPARFLVRGIAPVDGADGRTLRDSAIRAHATNERVHDRAVSADYRDDDVFDGISADSMSPAVRLQRASTSGIATYAWSGWYDGALATAAIARFRARGSDAHLLLGPWTHVGNRNVSPYRRDDEPAFDAEEELQRFFDSHLASSHMNTADQSRVRFYVVGAEEWRTSSAWPPPDVMPSHFVLGDGRIAESHASTAGADTLTFAPFSAGTETRWDALIAGPYRNVRLGLPTISASARTFRGPTMAAPIEVIGTPVVRLRVLPLASGDAVVTAYLREVDAAGTTRPITEGTFRLANRYQSGVDPVEPWVPLHTFRKADARPVRAGETTTVSFALLPIAYRVPAGHRLELVITGCDTAHFRNSLGPAPRVVLTEAGPQGSALILPLATSARSSAEGVLPPP